MVSDLERVSLLLESSTSGAVVAMSSAFWFSTEAATSSDGLASCGDSVKSR